MLILGLESSCDETSAAVVDVTNGEKRVLSNVVASQIDIHKLYGGVVPEIASRAHIEAISNVVREAVTQANTEISQLGAIAVTDHPGLIGALLVGVNFAKSLAYANQIPLVPVNHIYGHVAAAYLEHPDLKPPYLAVVVSGGHTAIYMVKTYTDFELLGSTRDDAAGESFDKIGRVMGMPYPSGAALDKIAYTGNPNAFTLPSPALSDGTLDFSFSGLKTASLNLIHQFEQKHEELPVADISACFTQRVVEGIAGHVEKAVTAPDVCVSDVVLAGGVAANSHLRARLQALCVKLGLRFCVPSVGLCGDNAAMIAAQGYFEFAQGHVSGTHLNASAED